MSRLSRLLEKLNVTNETPAPRPPPPDVPTGPMTIVIDASRHIVESVTLFRNCTAQVVRTFQDLKLRSGENTVVINNLPHAMQPESLRVSNSGSYATLDVLCTRERDEECERRSEVLLAELEQSKKRREEVMKMLRDYGNSLAVSPTSQKNIFKFTDKYLSVANECDAEVRNIEQKLKAEKASLAAWRGSQKSFRGVAQLTLFTKRNTVAALTVTYMVDNASWSPLYDLRAISQKGRPSSNVHLHYRANLCQSTGEDWNDAQLTLSTRAPEDLDGGIPRANTIQIWEGRDSRYVPSFFTAVSIPPIPRYGRYRSLTPVRGKSAVRSPRRPRCHMSRSSSRSSSRDGRVSRSPIRRARRRMPVSRSRSKSRDGSRRRACRVIRIRGRSPSRSPRRASVSRSPSPPRRYSTRGGFENRIIRSRSPRLRRSRGSIAASDPPEYPFHPTEAAMITSDVTSISFIMDGRCSIPGDGKLHRVTIAILPFAATIHHVITPRRSLDAYLQCSIPNDSNYTLLPGVLSTFLDDKYVSKTSIPEISTGDTLRCTLGIDTAVKVTHSITSETSKPPEAQSVGQFKTVTYTSKTVIRNRRFDGAIDVVERTNLPVVSPQSAETSLKVLLKEPPGLAESESSDPIDLNRPDGFRVQWGTGDGDTGLLKGNILDKEQGKFMWVGTVEAGDEAVLESVWDVRAPVDIPWNEVTVLSR